MKKRKWSTIDLKRAVNSSTSYRQVIGKLKLKMAGGNYNQIKKYIKENSLNINHFKGKGWSKNFKFEFKPKIPLVDILVKNSDYQSYKLKKRLFRDRLKTPKCEICGWAKKTIDGRIPVELDHINGNNRYNRIGNLRILCPNCHSLQSTHRGKNIKKH